VAVRPWTYTLLAAALAFLAGTLLFAADNIPRTSTAFLTGTLCLGLALGMYLTERNGAVALTPEQERRVRALVREGRKLKAIRRVQNLGGVNLKEAFRYVHRVEKQEFARA